MWNIMKIRKITRITNAILILLWLLVGCVLDSSNPPRNGSSGVFEQEFLTVSPQTAHTENTRETEILSASTSGVTGTPASTSTSPSVEAGRNPFLAGTPIPPEANAIQLSFVSKVDGSISTNWDLFIVNRDGSINRLTEGFRIIYYQWSPDGNEIAFVSSGYQGGELYIMNANGSNLRQITGYSGTQMDISFDWSPDNKNLLLASQMKGNVDIYLIDVDSLEVTQVTHTIEIDEINPQWSPNGDQIIFTAKYVDKDDADIFLMDANGTNLKQLTNSPQYESLPKWSPDGSKVAYQLYESMNYQLWVMDQNGNNQRKLANTFVIDYTFPGDYAWSPDSQKIAFIPSPYFWVEIVDVVQGKIMQTPGVFEFTNQVRWHPNGKIIAFTGVRDWNMDIYLVDVMTMVSTQVTNHEADQWFSEWRP